MAELMGHHLPIRPEHIHQIGKPPAPDEEIRPAPTNFNFGYFGRREHLSFEGGVTPSDGNTQALALVLTENSRHASTTRSRPSGKAARRVCFLTEAILGTSPFRNPRRLTILMILMSLPPLPS